MVCNCIVDAIPNQDAVYSLVYMLLKVYWRSDAVCAVYQVIIEAENYNLIL